MDDIEKEIEDGIKNYENVKGTWAYEMREHWEQFSNAIFKSFNNCAELMNFDGKMDKYQWREYLLYDMYKRHKKDVK